MKSLTDLTKEAFQNPLKQKTLYISKEKEKEEDKKSPATLEGRSEYQKRYYQEHKDEIRKYQKEYYQEHKKKLKGGKKKRYTAPRPPYKETYNSNDLQLSFAEKLEKTLTHILNRTRYYTINTSGSKRRDNTFLGEPTRRRNGYLPVGGLGGIFLREKS